MAWTSALPDRESRGLVQPETKIINEFQDEFDVVPMPDVRQYPKKIDCRKDNMNYIKSSLPMQHVGLQDFYTDMAKRQWKAVKPLAPKGMAPAFANMKGPNGIMGMAIGARRDMVANQVADRSRPLLPKGGASDWKSIPQLERVNAYAFRGDRRHPRLIKAANGFHPPCTRTDSAYVPVIANRFAKYMKERYNQDVDKSEIEQYIRGKGQAGRVFTDYEVWRSILKGEEMHIGRMVVDEFLKGYISTTRSINVALEFANRVGADGKSASMTGIYTVHSEGGFLMPDIHKHSHALNSEAEIAHPGSLPWNKIKAFRIHVQGNAADARTWGRTIRHIFVRREFRLQDPEGAYEVLTHLSSIWTV